MGSCPAGEPHTVREAAAPRNLAVVVDCIVVGEDHHNRLAVEERRILVGEVEPHTHIAVEAVEHHSLVVEGVLHIHPVAEDTGCGVEERRSLVVVEVGHHTHHDVVEVVLHSPVGVEEPRIHLAVEGMGNEEEGRRSLAVEDIGLVVADRTHPLIRISDAWCDEIGYWYTHAVARSLAGLHSMSSKPSRLY